MVDDEPSHTKERESNQTANEHQVPAVAQPAPHQEQETCTDQQETKRHLRIRTIAKRRRSIRRKTTVAFYVQVIGASATLAIAVLTGFYVHYSNKQWQAMLTANEQTKTALHVSQRAYVTSGMPMLNPEKRIVTIPFTNNGHIPSGRIAKIVWTSCDAVDIQPYIEALDGYPHGKQCR